MFSMIINCFYLFFVFWSSIIFICFSKAFPKGEDVNIAFSITLFWSDGNIFFPVRYLYLPIFPGDNADFFAASMLILYCSFLYLTWLAVIFFPIDSFWKIKDYLMQELHQSLKKNMVLI